MQGLRGCFYAPQNVEKPFFTATEQGVSPNLHPIDGLEITYWPPTNMTLLHNGMHIIGQQTCYWHKNGFTFETKKRLIAVTHSITTEYKNSL